MRRRDICTLCVLCSAVTLVSALATGSLWAVVAFAVTAGASGGYCAALARRRRSGPTAEIHYLPVRAPLPASTTVTMVRRTAAR